jgi:sugar phosphate isomerase/epimerase
VKLSFSNGIFRRCTLQENVAQVKQLGFENIEFNMKSVETESDTSIHEADRLVALSGLRCLTLHNGSLHVKDPVEVHRAVYYGKISLDFARALKAPVMVVHSNIARKLADSQRRDVLAEVFGEITHYAKKLNVKLALENLSYSSSGYGKNVAELEEILGVIDPANEMGFTLDFCHAEATGQTAELLDKYHGRLCNVHLSNRAHKPFMEPTERLLFLIEKLREYGYAGPLTLELSRKCTLEQIAQTKKVVETVLKH